MQAVSEGVVAAYAVLASLSASGVFDRLGWRGANAAPLALCVLLLGWLLVTRTDAARPVDAALVAEEVPC